MMNQILVVDQSIEYLQEQRKLEVALVLSLSSCSNRCLCSNGFDLPLVFFKKESPFILMRDCHITH